MIHLVHTLGGCGGTLLSRCLGVLPDTAVLSEVNPNSIKLYPHFDPLYQDDRWLHLLSREERARFSQIDLGTTANFCSLMEAFHARSSETGRHLILRDWNYIDFFGVPFNAQPPRRLTVYEALPGAIPVAAVAFIRHPLDQWASLCKHQELRSTLKPALFCDGYLAFLHRLENIPVYKYEDFLADPQEEMRAICGDLSLPFEPSFLEKFHTFDSVTGDFDRLRDTSISPPRKVALDAASLDEFRNSASYKDMMTLTGYREC